MLAAKYILKITKCTKSISNIIPWVDYLRHVQVWIQLEIETCLANKYCPSLPMYTPMSRSTSRENQSINQLINQSINHFLFEQSINQPINLFFQGEKQLLNGPDVQNANIVAWQWANAITSIERPTSRVYLFVSLAHMKIKQKHKFLKHVLLRSWLCIPFSPRTIICSHCTMLPSEQVLCGRYRHLFAKTRRAYALSILHFCEELNVFFLFSLCFTATSVLWHFFYVLVSSAQGNETDKRSAWHREYTVTLDAQSN